MFLREFLVFFKRVFKSTDLLQPSFRTLWQSKNVFIFLCKICLISLIFCTNAERLGFMLWTLTGSQISQLGLRHVTAVMLVWLCVSRSCSGSSGVCESSGQETAGTCPTSLLSHHRVVGIKVTACERNESLSVSNIILLSLTDCLQEGLSRVSSEAQLLDLMGTSCY